MPLENTSPTFLSSGSLDTAFASDGTQSVNIGIAGSAAEAIAIQSDGKYVVAGWSLYASYRSTMLRFNFDGSLDTSFSSYGYVHTGKGKAHDVAIQPDGMIVSVGEIGSGTAIDFLLARNDATGQPDVAFSGDGVQVVSLAAGTDVANAVAIQPDGRILIAGRSENSFALLRFETTGVLDASFDGDGSLTSSFGTNTASANAMVLQEDGKIIVAGYGWNGSGWDLGIARLTDTGALDTSFSGDGKALISVDNTSAQEVLNAIAIQADGKIVLAGYTTGSGVDDMQDAVLIRLNTNGTLDTSFGGGDGIVILDNSTRDEFNSVQIQADGKIFAAGSDANDFGNALIARFNADGTLDTSFAGAGIFTSLYGFGTSTINDLAFAANGQLVAVGDSYTGTYDFGILRLASGLTDQIVMTGDAYSYSVPSGAIYDADADTLTYSASLADGAPLPEWLTFNPATATFSGTPATGDFGTLRLAVQANDGAASASTSFQLEISTEFIEALRSTDHARWNDSVANGTPGTVLTYSFMTAAPSYALLSESSTFAPMNETQKAAVRDVLQQYQDIAGISFIEVADAGDGGQLRFGTNLDVNSGNSGYAYYPSSLPAGGDVWINRASTGYAAPEAGNAAYWVLLHEIGHALGFKHPGLYGDDDPPFLPGSVDTNQYTVMSYNNHDEGTSTGYHASTPMLFDIATLQFLYGANTETRTGNDTYTFDPTALNIETLWDGGGIDTIDISNFSEDALIDLRASEFSSLHVLLPAYEWIGQLGNNNVAIAYGSVIENATGGSGNDTLIGNAASNILSGGLGNDTYIVDTPGDRAIETSSGGFDSVRASLSWILGTNLENLELLGTYQYSASGNSQSNTLTGNEAGNILDGGRGADTLIGGNGNDTYLVDNANDVIQETGTDASDSVRSRVDWTLGDDLENLVLLGPKSLNGTGNGNDNSLTGNGGANTLNGSGGNDILDGASGNDSLTGSSGADTFAFTTPLNAERNVDIITDFVSGEDKILLSANIFREIGFNATPGTDAFFHTGSAAHDADDRILYDQTNGALYYDADGNGSLAAMQFALLSSAPTLLYSDLVVS